MTVIERSSVNRLDDARSSDEFGDPMLLDPARHGDYRLVESVEPSVVFASLAACCVPELCDDCTINIVDGSHARYRIAYPPRSATAGGLRRIADRAGETPDHRVRVAFAGPKAGSASPDTDDEHGGPQAFRGVATFMWHRRTPTRSDQVMASMLVGAAVNSVMSQRTEQRAAAAVAHAAHLKVALQSSRHIGVAIGILMGLRKITEDQAFELLRRASQRHNRNLRDLALDVVDTGWLDPGPNADALRPGEPSQ